MWRRTLPGSMDSRAVLCVCVMELLSRCGLAGVAVVGMGGHAGHQPVDSDSRRPSTSDTGGKQ